MPVIRWLQALKIPFVMPVIIRGKQGGTKSLIQGRCRFIYYGNISVEKEEEGDKFYPSYLLLNKCWNFYVKLSTVVMK